MSTTPLNDPWLFSLSLGHEHLFLFSAYVLGSLVLGGRATSMDSRVLLSLSSTGMSCQQHGIINSLLAHRRAAVHEHIVINANTLI